MQYEDIRVFDIMKDSYWEKRVIHSIPLILNSGHHNAENYRHLGSRLHKYDCFNVVVDVWNDELLAISGLYNGGVYPRNVVRVLDRTYYYNWRDNTSSIWKSDTRYNSTYMLPYQIDLAKELGYDYAFTSVQNNRKRNSLKRLTSNWDIEFTMLDGMYNTCRTYNDDGNYIGINNDRVCWQNVAIHKLSNTTKPFSLPTISIDEYDDRYTNTKSIR